MLIMLISLHSEVVACAPYSCCMCSCSIEAPPFLGLYPAPVPLLFHLPPPFHHGRQNQKGLSIPPRQQHASPGLCRSLPNIVWPLISNPIPSRHRSCPVHLKPHGSPTGRPSYHHHSPAFTCLRRLPPQTSNLPTLSHVCLYSASCTETFETRQTCRYQEKQISFPCPSFTSCCWRLGLPDSAHHASLIAQVLCSSCSFVACHLPNPCPPPLL